MKKYRLSKPLTERIKVTIEANEMQMIENNELQKEVKDANLTNNDNQITNIQYKIIMTKEFTLQ